MSGRGKTVCLDCRVASKGSPPCTSPTEHIHLAVGKRYRVPPKRDRRAWRAMREQWLADGTLPYTEHQSLPPGEAAETFGFRQTRKQVRVRHVGGRSHRAVRINPPPTG